MSATIGQLARHSRIAERGSLTFVVEREFGVDTVENRRSDLVPDRVDVGLLGTDAVEPVDHARLHDVIDDLLDTGRAKFLFCLAAELRFREGHFDDGYQALLHVVFDRFVLVGLGQLGQLSHVLEQDIVDGPVHRLFESGEVCAALASRDRVDERDDVRVESVDPAHRNVNGALAFDELHLAVHRDLLFEGVDSGKFDDVCDRR